MDASKLTAETLVYKFHYINLWLYLYNINWQPVHAHKIQSCLNWLIIKLVQLASSRKEIWKSQMEQNRALIYNSRKNTYSSNLLNIFLQTKMLTLLEIHIITPLVVPKCSNYILTFIGKSASFIVFRSAVYRKRETTIYIIINQKTNWCLQNCIIFPKGKQESIIPVKTWCERWWLTWAIIILFHSDSVEMKIYNVRTI